MGILFHCSFAAQICVGALSVVTAAAQFGCSSTFDDLKLKSEPAQSCGHAQPPNPPGVVTGDFERIEFVTAVKEYDMGERDQGGVREPYRTMGYDLDDTCTGLGEGPSCTNSFWRLEDPIIDGPDGRDNTEGAVMYRTFERLKGDGATAEVNAIAGSGTNTTVIRVRGYNGQTLDSQVEVAVFGATMKPFDEKSLPIGNPSAPLWEGEDVWAAGFPWWVDKDEAGVWSTEHPKFFDSDAWVTDSVLVVHLDHYAVPAFVEMSQVVITARIVQTEFGWALTDGIFAGRAKTDTLLASFEYLRDPETQKYICTSSENYRTYKEMACAAADVTFEKSDDPSAPCDATSWGWRFEAEPAKLSGTGTAPVFHNCRAEELPSHDSCARHD